MSSVSSVGTRAALFALCLVLVACAATRSWQPYVVPGEKPITALAPGMSTTSPVSRLSCRGDEFTVDYLDVLDAIPEGPLEEQKEQLRDWIWTALLGRVAAATSVANVFAGEVLEVPSQRLDSMPGVLQGSFGPTRATTDSGNRSIVLVDFTLSKDPSGDALEAIDDEAARLGRQPLKATVYGYSLDPRVARAHVCITQQYDRDALESARTGFRATTASSAQGLDAFLSGGVDLLGVQCAADGLHLTGRHRERNAGAPATVAHIAAIARSYASGNRRNRAGFSLDPRPDLFDSVQAASDVAEARRALQSGRLAGLFSKWHTTRELQDAARDVSASESQIRSLEYLELSIGEQLPIQNEMMLEEFGTLESPAGLVARAVASRDSRQCARYEGALAGTDAGMTLFYTDLMAKKAALDTGNAGIFTEVLGFHGPAQQVIATQSCVDNHSERGRLWFGMRAEAIRVGAQGTTFGPLGVRLFGKARESAFEEEVDFNGADLQAYLLWWDRHFGSVARWEPQYELLNQLIKWSAAFAQPENYQCGRFLESYPLGPKRRFDEWLNSSASLRWRGPAQLSAAERPLECIETLVSEPYRYCSLTFGLDGGVSGATHEEVLGRRQAAALTNEARRIESVGRGLRVTPRGITFDEIVRADSELRQGRVEATAAAASLDVAVSPKRLTRGASESWSFVDPWTGSDGGEMHLKRSVSLSGTELHSLQSLGGFGIGHLRYQDLPSATVKLRAEGGDTLRTVRQFASRVLEKQRRGLSFEQAARAVLPADAMKVLDAEHVEVTVFDAVHPPVIATLSSGGGIRGPPSPVGFVQGIPTTRLPPGERNVGKFVVGVALRPASDGKSFPKHSAVAVESQLRSAAQKGDWKAVERDLARLVGGRGPVPPEVLPDLHYVATLARRDGLVSSNLEHLEMLAGFDSLTPRAGDISPEDLRATARTAAIYTPTGSVSVSDLPPVSYPLGVAPRSGQSFASRVFDAAFSKSPDVLTYRTANMKRARDVIGATDDPSAFGSPYRLAGMSTHRIMIVASCDDQTYRSEPGKVPCHCSDTDPTLPPCHE